MCGERAKSNVVKEQREKFMNIIKDPSCVGSFLSAINHTMKLYTKNDTVCAKCAVKGHDIKDCQRNTKMLSLW